MTGAFSETCVYELLAAKNGPLSRNYYIVDKDGLGRDAQAPEFVMSLPAKVT